MPKMPSHDERTADPTANPTFIHWTEGGRVMVGAVRADTPAGWKARFRATVDGGVCVMRDLKAPGKVAGPVGDCVFWAWDRLVREANQAKAATVVVSRNRRKKRAG